jgi:SH3 domain
VFVTAVRGSGWVPSRYLSADEGRTVVETSYNTTELPTRKGEILEVLDRDDESGWLWCRSAEAREGWVPARVLEATDRMQSS